MKQSPYRTTGASNGVAEGINLLIKKIKRVGHGFRNFRQLPAPTSCRTAASNDRLPAPQECEAANHA